MKRHTPSETALRIAANKVAAALDPELRKVVAYPDEPYSEWFIRAHSLGARMRLGVWTWRPTRRLIYRLSDARIPGAPLHLLLRKRFVADAVREVLRDEAHRPEQVVIFGAGFDPLPLVLHEEFPAVRFIEIDHPDTQAVKRRALEEHRALTPSVTFVPVDFTAESAEEKLLAAKGFQPNACGLFLAEGVLMYLPQAEVDALFATVRRNSAPGSRFIFTFLDSAALEDAESPVAQMARDLERVGEPFRSSQDRKKLDGFLRKHGFKRRAVADHQTLRTSYLLPAGMDRPLVRGEVIVVAQAV